jgi:hypothetical protein
MIGYKDGYYMPIQTIASFFRGLPIPSSLLSQACIALHAFLR